MTRDVHTVIHAIELLAMGALATASVFLPLEFAVFAGGPMLALVALLYAVSKAVERDRAEKTFLGIVGILLGLVLATHDYIFRPDLAIPVHLATALAILVVGGFVASLARADASPRQTA